MTLLSLHTHEHTHTASTCRHIQTSPTASHMQTCLTLLYIQSRPNTFIYCRAVTQSGTASIFHVCAVVGCCCVKSRALSKDKRALAFPATSVTLCVCVADGTHVWSVVAGWLEPGVGGGFIWGRGSERVCGGGTLSPINKCFTTVHLPVWVVLVLVLVVGAWRHGGLSVRGAKECVNGATTASSIGRVEVGGAAEQTLRITGS